MILGPIPEPVTSLSFFNSGQVPKDEFYNIESHVGASVATQLRTGNKVRVGVNGKLQSDSLRVKKWKNEENAEEREM